MKRRSPLRQALAPKMPRLKGSANKVHCDAAANGEQNEEQDGADDADIAEPDLQQLVLTLSRTVEQQGRNVVEQQGCDMLARLSMLEQRSGAEGQHSSPADPARGVPHAAYAESIAGSTVASNHSTVQDLGSLFDIVGDADPDYQHDPDTAHISTLWRGTSEHRKSSATWTQDDLEVLNSSSLHARVTLSVIEAFSRVPTDANGHVDNALAGLYAAEEQLRRTFGPLHLRLLAPEKTTNTVWRAALARHAQAQQRQSINGMQFVLPSLAEIMAEVNKKSAEDALKDLLAAQSHTGGASLKDKKTPRSDDDDEMSSLKAELKASKEKNNSNERRVKYATKTLKEHNIEWQMPPNAQQTAAAAAKGKRRDKTLPTNPKPPTGEGEDTP